MSEENFIKIENGIGVSQQRQLIEMTNTLARALTESEFLTIVKIYGSVTDRLLNQSS
ncbi:MAG: hypothetical protein ACRC7R_00805 [Sarcina sp.]